MFSHVMIGSNDIEASRIFYDAIMKELGVKNGIPNQLKGITRYMYFHKKNIFRPFKNSSDNNEWNVRLSSNRYLKFIKEINEVGVLTKGSGYVDVKKYLLKSKKYFKKNNRYFCDTFKSKDLGISNDFFSYNNKKFRNIIRDSLVRLSHF